MHNNKQRRGKYALLALNCLTTAAGIGSVLFTLAFIFVLIVSIASGKINELRAFVGLLLHPGSFPELLPLLCLFFVVLSILIEILRLAARNWIARFAEREKYLLTWKKLWSASTRAVIIQRLWNFLQTLWVGFILALVISTAGQVLAIPKEDVDNTAVFQAIHWIFHPPLGLAQLLALWTIILFIAITLLIRLLAQNQTKEMTVISVKELEPVRKSLDAASNHLQTLSADFARRVLEGRDEQIIQELAEKMLEPLEQKLEQEQDARLLLAKQLEQEQDARAHLEEHFKQEQDARAYLKAQLKQMQDHQLLLTKQLDQEANDRLLLAAQLGQVQELLRQVNASHLSTSALLQNQPAIIQKLNHFEEPDSSSSELIM